MNVIIDTSVWIEYFKGRDYPDVDAALQECRTFLSPLIISELVSGSLAPSAEKKLLDFLNDLPSVETDTPHWIEVGRLRRKLRSKGFNLSTPDAHILQAALDISGVLYTRDGIFKKVSQLVGLKVNIFE